MDGNINPEKTRITPVEVEGKCSTHPVQSKFVWDDNKHCSLRRNSANRRGKKDFLCATTIVKKCPLRIPSSKEVRES